YLFGRRSHVAHLRRGTWVLPSGSWMLVQEAGCIRSKTWSVIVEEGVAESAITQSASLLRSLLAQDARMRSTIELKRLEVRSAEERRLMNASCLELAKVLEPDASGPKSGDALEAVLFRVAAESGIKLHERTLQAEGRPTARLKAFARANQFRTRR